MQVNITLCPTLSNNNNNNNNDNKENGVRGSVVIEALG
jgi:hypothetical protein